MSLEMTSAMTPDLTFRHAQPEDADRCYAIEAGAYEGDEAATLAKITKRIREYPLGFLIMEHDGQIIGFINSGCAYEVRMSDEEFKELVGHDAAAPNVVIMSVVIDPAFQGRGYATTMMHTFVEQMRAEDKKTSTDVQGAACGAVLSPGIQYQRPSDSDHGGMAWHEMVMAL
jgi:ribosomal protein S18 acetylase RimI-like enzyme